MAKRSLQLFVSRLSFYTTNEELRGLFAPFGDVKEARLVIDPRTQRPKGFGFVTFESETDAQNALKALNGKMQVMYNLEFKPMGEFPALARSSIMLPHIQVQAWHPTRYCLGQYQPMSVMPLSLCVWTGPLRNICMQPKPILLGISAVSDSKAPTTFTVDSAGEGYDVLPDSGGSGDGSGDTSGNGGNGSNNGGNEGGSDEGKDQNGESVKKKDAVSMSQKLTLGYAFLVGAGGVIGYLKSGSLKSLIAGGFSASLLYYVYNTLPTNPVFASSVGFILSAGLLGVMGSRFVKSKKIFPAGVVSIVSFVMTGGYLHGIMRSVH